MTLVREGQKTLTAAVVVLLLALGLAACGGGDGDSSSTTTAAGAQAKKEGQSSGIAAKNGGAKGNGEGGSGAGGGEGKSGGKSQSGGSGSGSGSDREASEFTPKQHKDTGGGSKQYRAKGGDNSVQEFGREADSTEFNAAAVALHNFLDARAESNWAAACEYMSKGIVETFEKLAKQSKQIKATGCGEILQKLTNPAAKQSMKAEAAKANVGSLRTDGDRSFVIYTSIGDTILAMPMANEGGTWKVVSLAGTPLN